MSLLRGCAACALRNRQPPLLVAEEVARAHVIAIARLGHERVLVVRRIDRLDAPGDLREWRLPSFPARLAGRNRGRRIAPPAQRARRLAAEVVAPLAQKVPRVVELRLQRAVLRLLLDEPV